jgi:hypothetical protein
MNSYICFDENNKIDFGSKVVLWNESPNYSFYNGKYQARDSKKALNEIKQCVMHHTVTYNAKQTFSGLNARGLSVNFIVDDDINEDGCATIYQCLMIKDIGWSQKPVNNLGPGVEICYMPQAWQDDKLYSEANRAKFKVQDHEIMSEKVHGMNMKVFKPTKAQLEASAKIAYAVNHFCPAVELSFPKNADGSYIKTVIPNVEKYSGLLGHYNITTNKIDPSGFDHEYVEWFAVRYKEES